MIPYPDLVAALERWRLRNGLPVGGGGLPSASASVSSGYAAPSYAPPVSSSSASFGSFAPPAAPRPSAPMTAPPGPAPVTTKIPDRAQTDEPLDLHDDDVLDEDMLAPEGGDFAMAFGVSSAKPADPAPGYDDEDAPEEKTAIGLPDEPHTSPFSTETQPGFDTLDADGEILDEHDDPDPKRRP